MNLEDLSKPLRADQIDFRVQSINKGGYATILAYKDARCDMQRLDDVCGPLLWKREHSRDNHNCTVSIWCQQASHWVGKEDTGTESQAEAAKGLASDSFKRACFNWGIGRELYDYPNIQIKLNEQEFTVEGQRVKQTWKLKLREWKWYSEFNDDGKLAFLRAVDDKGDERYRMGQAAPLFTAEQKAAYVSLMAARDGWGLKSFGKEVGNDIMTALFNDAPDRQKTSQKALCNELVTKANGELKASLAGIQEAMDANSSSAIEEILAECGDIERDFVIAGLTEVQLRQAETMGIEL